MIYAKEPTDQILPISVRGLEEIDYRKCRIFYRVDFKYFYNYGIFRANGYGPHGEMKKNQLRAFYFLSCGEKAPRKFNDLCKAFADKGFTVQEVKLTGRYGQMRETVSSLVI